jgi:hypothetical protein
MPVRPFTEDDIRPVADLYWTVQRERYGSSPVALRSSIHELYFKNPWIDGSQPSLVFDDRGKVTGFLGVVPRRMSLGGQSVLTAFGGNFVVHPDSRTSLAGLHLLRTYMSAGQDLSLTDSANDVSRVLLERLGFTTILDFSLHWVRVLRPARFAAFAISRLAANAVAASIVFAARPFCAAVDRLAGSLSFSPFCQREPSLQGTELDVGTLLACQQEFRNGYSLWPEYDANSLTWLLSFMARMKRHGDLLRKVVLRDQAGKIVGWYIYTATPGRMGEVVQIGGKRRNTKNILDHLFHDAWSNDVIALRGIVDRQWMADFSEKNCFFTCRGGWMVAHSRKPAFLEPLNSGDAFLSRLDGEWCLAFRA